MSDAVTGEREELIETLLRLITENRICTELTGLNEEPCGECFVCLANRLSALPGAAASGREDVIEPVDVFVYEFPADGPFDVTHDGCHFYGPRAVEQAVAAALRARAAPRPGGQAATDEIPVQLMTLNELADEVVRLRLARAGAGASEPDLAWLRSEAAEARRQEAFWVADNGRDDAETKWYREKAERLERIAAALGAATAEPGEAGDHRERSHG